MRRALLLAGAVWTLLAAMAAASASAATYVGEGRNDPRVKVQFGKQGNWIEGFTVTNARFVCTDGDPFRDREGTEAGRMRIDAEGRFDGEFGGTAGGFLLRVDGIVRRGRAHGDLRMILASSPGDECHTERIEWRARRQAS